MPGSGLADMSNFNIFKDICCSSPVSVVIPSRIKGDSLVVPMTTHPNHPHPLEMSTYAIAIPRRKCRVIISLEGDNSNEF